MYLRSAGHCRRADQGQIRRLLAAKFHSLVADPPLNRRHESNDNSAYHQFGTVRRTTMYTTITLHRSNRQVGDLDLNVTLALAVVGLTLTALAFAFLSGFAAEYGQILALAG
jgi:hypothetical protein